MIKFNGQDLADIKYNGQSIKRVMKDGVQIWPNAEPLQIPTGITLLEIFEGVPNIPTGIQTSEYEIEPAFTYLLDDYPGAAAYSLRKLRTGAEFAVEVRRDGASPATTNVLLYDDPSKSIDLLSLVEAGGTLGDWVGANSGFVSLWYDQSGNGHNVTQSIALDQPRLVSSGVLEVDNGISSINFNTSTPSVSLSSSTYLGGVSNSGFVVNSATSTNCRVFTFNSDSSGLRNKDNNELAINGTSDVRITVGYTGYGQSLVSYFGTPTWGNYLNGASGTGSGSWGSFNNEYLLIGNSVSLVLPWFGYIQEIIFYNTDQSSNRTAIETNINNHYSIFLTSAEVDAALIEADLLGTSGVIYDYSNDAPRTTASDTAVASLIARNNTIITA